jgi:hypothetical protein
VAIDLQTIEPQEVVHLNQVRVTPGPPRTVAILGDDFRAVDEVLINGVASPDFVVVSKTQLLAQVPESATLERINSVQVLSKKLTLSDRSQLRIRIGRTPGRVTGILRLMQLFLKILFTTPGRDIFSPRIGGGALKNVGATFGSSEGNDIVNDFVIAVDTTSRQIIAIQGRDSSIPRDERLLGAKVLSAAFNRDVGGIDVSVQITTQAGREATANVGL